MRIIPPLFFFSVSKLFSFGRPAVECAPLVEKIQSFRGLGRDSYNNYRSKTIEQIKKKKMEILFVFIL